MQNKELIKQLLEYPMDSEVELLVNNTDDSPVVIEGFDYKFMELSYVGDDGHDISPKIFLTAMNKHWFS